MQSRFRNAQERKKKAVAAVSVVTRAFQILDPAELLVLVITVRGLRANDVGSEWQARASHRIGVSDAGGPHPTRLAPIAPLPDSDVAAHLKRAIAVEGEAKQAEQELSQSERVLRKVASETLSIPESKFDPVWEYIRGLVDGEIPGMTDMLQKFPENLTSQVRERLVSAAADRLKAAWRTKQARLSRMGRGRGSSRGPFCNTRGGT